ncbi:MAG: tetratricopeptide repeat protein [Gemmatimonadales bacterium]|nr:tetratricopeptide repeat protein [Gemmatimonadales bacterium]
MSADDIRALSEQLAADPHSLAFLPLAEALLSRGDLEHAARVAQRGAVRHAGRTEAHDLVARIALARGDEARAESAWESVLALEPRFGTAHRGLGLVRYRQGRLDEALFHLTQAAADDPADDVVRSALEAVRGVVEARDAKAPSPRKSAIVPADVAGESAAALFDPILEDSRQVALLLDAEGLIAAGEYRTADGRDLGPEIGAHLTGVSDEADRAMRHFGFGAWTRLVIETEAATVAMAPVEDAMALVAAPADVPLGFARRTLERCLGVARTWLGSAR